MAENLKEVFDTECKDLTISPALVKKINAYRIGFVTRSQDHIDFFGGNLLGVHPVRFRPSDRDAWFHEIMETDETVLANQISKLESYVPTFKVASDTMNNACVWMMHAIFNSPRLDAKQKHQGMLDVALMLNYKFFTSRVFRLFEYPADPDVAAAAYNELSKKFALKQLGTWARVFEARSEEIISTHSIHYFTITMMDDDIAVRYLLSDTSGRIRDIIKNIVDIQFRLAKQGTKISSTSSLIQHDKDQILKDRVNSINVYGRYLSSIITDKRAFIKPIVGDVITSFMPTMDPRYFYKTLEWISDNYRKRSGQTLEQLSKDILVHAFGYLYENRQVMKNTSDLAMILSRLKGTYTASRNGDPALLKLRKDMEGVVQKATGLSATNVQTAAVRTGCLLYIVARTMSMHYYQNLR